MTRLRARRTEVTKLDVPTREALRRRGAREGFVHASDDLVVVGLGTAQTVPLPHGLHDVDAPDRVAGALDAIALEGAAGPGGSGVLAAGALPFDADAATVLVVPRLLASWQPDAPSTWLTEVLEEHGSFDPFASALVLAEEVAAPAGRNEIRSKAVHPSDASFHSAVTTCIEHLRRGELEKAVLARFVAGRCRDPIDAAAIAATLHRLDPTCDLFAFPDGAGRVVGASPELVVATTDGAVTAHPLAGTVRLGGDLDDEEQVAWLLASQKNRAEHAVVVEDIVARLAPLCEALHAASAPCIVRLSTNARLGTWVDGKLLGSRDAATAFRVLAALHPTPAVGGVPRAKALRAIRELEAAPRGPWAGPVGWVDADGTSTWTLGLRSVRAVGDRFEVWGGAGIVAASEPDDEVGEISEKLASVLRVLEA
jgi:isochorismate synthase